MIFKKIFAVIGLFGVILGASGAHYLKSFLDADHLETWKTATFYLFIHTLAGLFASQNSVRNRSAFCFLFGILLFSGSLYTLAFFRMTIVGAITPVGGVLFLLGWLFLALDLRGSIGNKK